MLSLQLQNSLQLLCVLGSLGNFRRRLILILPLSPLAARHPKPPFHAHPKKMTCSAGKNAIYPGVYRISVVRQTGTLECFGVVGLRTYSNYGTTDFLVVYFFTPRRRQTR